MATKRIILQGQGTLSVVNCSLADHSTVSPKLTHTRGYRSHTPDIHSRFLSTKQRTTGSKTGGEVATEVLKSVFCLDYVLGVLRQFQVAFTDRISKSAVLPSLASLRCLTGNVIPPFLENLKGKIATLNWNPWTRSSYVVLSSHVTFGQNGGCCRSF